MRPTTYGDLVGAAIGRPFFIHYSLFTILYSLFSILYDLFSVCAH